MRELERQDLRWALRRTPAAVLKLLKDQPGKVFVAGGFLRACVANEQVSDIDLFVASKELAKVYAMVLEAKAGDGAKVYETDNAITVKGYPIPVQIVHRWTWDSCEECISSFDFTIAMAGFWWDADDATHAPQYRPQPGWRSICDDRFYPDLAAKRLRYTSPIRNEDAGGSMLRVLKFYQCGYRIPLDSLATVTARFVQGVREYGQDEADFARVLTGLLREVDPNIDPSHIAHLPSDAEEHEAPGEETVNAES
jgi:hypothetical protein